MADMAAKLLEALNLDRSGHWDEAHSLVQPLEDTLAYWIHAYLHRKEGDQGNAAYWYQRAGKTVPEMALEDEWQAIHRILQP
ncbi:hypothetical protein ACFL6U_22995 [Planctomycetota bacterium]